MTKQACLVLGSLLMVDSALPNDQWQRADSFRSRPLPHYHTVDDASGLQAFEMPLVPVSTPFLTSFVHEQVERGLPPSYKGQAVDISEAIMQAASEEKMDPVFLMSIIRQESHFNPNARGSHGELGLMQLKPSTVRWYLQTQTGEHRKDSELPSEEEIQSLLLNPAMNIRLGAAYLAYLRSSFKDQGAMYVTAYNMGAELLRLKLKMGKHPSVYLNNVMGYYDAFNIDLSTEVSSRTTSRETFASR